MKGINGKRGRERERVSKISNVEESLGEPFPLSSCFRLFAGRFRNNSEKLAKKRSKKMMAEGIYIFRVEADLETLGIPRRIL